MKIKLYILACWLLSGLVSCNDWLDGKAGNGNDAGRNVC